jgi:tRNA (guanine-N7-)-methyltransferase
MRLRNIAGAEEAIANSCYVIHEPKSYQGNFHELFGNKNPIHIEIGMGKGKFIVEMAKRYPDINYIGMERYSSVLLRALQKIDALEEKPDNLKFMCIDAKEITDIFGAEEIDRIYLNFSDPWPKDRHAKRRLPSKEFLKLYDFILKKEGQLEFKTDNKALFDFAVNELPIANWKVKEITYDLHNDAHMNEGNVMTEYEEKFSSIGNPIYKYIIQR